MSDVVTVVDTNLALDHALRIGEDYKTYYAIANASPYPTLADIVNGYGFEQIEKVDDWCDWADGLNKGSNIVVFTDVGFGALANLLRKHNYYVFGADDRSEKLETNRIYARRILEKLDIDIPPADIVRGLTQLKEVVEKSEVKRYIKPNFIRGEFETFGCDSIDELNVKLTPGLQLLGDEMTFVCEKSLEGLVEIGFDAFISEDGFLDPIFLTYEMKGRGNATKVVSKDDNPWSDVIYKLEEWLVENGYRGMFCCEGFYDGDKIYVTDITCRFGYICSYAYPRLIDNFSDVIVNVAKGEDVKIKVSEKYSLQVGIYTDLLNSWDKICSYPDYVDEFIKFLALRKAIVKDAVWRVPGDCTIGCYVTNGKSIKDCSNECIKHIRDVGLPSTYIEPYEFLTDFEEARERLSELGYDF